MSNRRINVKAVTSRTAFGVWLFDCQIAN